MSERERSNPLDRVAWDDLRAVGLVASYGTIRGAAQEAGVAHTTIAHRVAAAERALGVTAFVRGPRGYAPTEAGRTVVAHVERMAFEARALTRHVGGADRDVAGTVRVSLVGTLLTHVLAPYLPSFTARHPKVVLRFSTATAFADLDRQTADVAVRFQDAPGADLIGSRVGEVYAALYASAGFDRARLAVPPVPVIGWSEGRSVAAAFSDLGLNDVRIVAVAADIHAQVALASGGDAVVQLPCYVGDAEPGLERLDPTCRARIRDAWVLTHASLRGAARIRVVTRFLANALRQEVGRLHGRREG